MSDCRNQAFIEAPVEVVWELIADVERHEEWWPRVRRDRVRPSSARAAPTARSIQTPFGDDEMNLHIDSMQEPDEFKIHCLNTGTFVRFGLTEAQGGTFVDGRMGMDPDGLFNKVFDAAAGRMYFRRWLAASLDAMAEAAEARAKEPSATA